ncbi:MAG: LacI family transcriptional regulator, partial [Streptomyces sp.]|nr:LacI family transcriptional regulator [Streptomyces sp.]
LKVHAAVEQLNYAPNKFAAALTTGRTENIGLIVPNLANPLFPEMVKAAQHQARGYRLAALLGDCDDDPDEEQRLIQALAKDVDGFLLFSSLLRDEQIAAMGGTLRPTVFVNREVTGYPCVLVDGLQGMRLLTQYLSNLGHTSVLYLPGPANSWAAEDRRRAITQAAEETGLGLEVREPTRSTFEAGTRAAEQLMHTPLPTAVVCFNDAMALGLTARLLALGVQVPGQISVVGWGGSQLAGYTTPAITTLAVPLREVGSAAVDLLQTAYGEAAGGSAGGSVAGSAGTSTGQPAAPSPVDAHDPVRLKVTLLPGATTGRARER